MTESGGVKVGKKLAWPRIELLDMTRAVALASEVGIRANLNEQPIWRALLHRDKLASAIYRLVTVQLFKSQLDPRTRELAIMRVAWRTASEFEWAQHWRFAVSLGISESELAGVRDWPSFRGFDTRDQAVLAAADDVVDTGAISDSCWSGLAEVLSPDELVDITFVITTWFFVSSLLKSFGVPLPEDMTPWLPDERRPMIE
jgi:4-carboxymuconolactone decarboxylase